MKKTIIVLSAFIMGCATVNAQKISYGIKAGVQQNTLAIREEGGGEWDRSLFSGVGFHIGGLANLHLSDQISLQPSVLFNSKSTVVSSEAKLQIYAVDIPINFLYNTRGFFFGLGPNLSYGLSAKTIGNIDGDINDDLYKKYPGEDEGVGESFLKRFEIGANLTMGYRFSNKLLLSGNYAQGLGNIYGEKGSDIKIRTKLIGLSVGYMFGK